VVGNCEGFTLLPHREDGTQMTDEQRNRLLLISVGIAMVLLAIAQHFGWIAGPPAALAPGIQ
jgi:hypothetical protein